MASRSRFALGLVTLLTLAGVAPADDLDLPDSKVEGSVQIVPWDLAILELFVLPTEAAAKEKFTPAKAPPTLREGWALVKEAARPRPTGPAGGADVFGPKEFVYAGWRVNPVGKDAGTTMLVAAIGGPDPKPGDAPPGSPPEVKRDQLPTFLAGGGVRLFCHPHVFMPLREDKRESTLSTLFRVLEWRVTIHEVSSDPKAFRGPALPDPDGLLPVIQVGSSSEVVGREFPVGSQGTALPQAEFTFRRRGAYEVRVFMRVSGRLSLTDEPEVKTAEAAIRVAVTDQTVDIQPLSFQKLNLPSRAVGKGRPKK